MTVKLVQKTLYLYEEDVEAFKALPNKTKWAHSNLNPKPLKALAPKIIFPKKT